MIIETLKKTEIKAFIPLYMKFVDHLRFDCNEIYFDYGPDIVSKLENQFIISIENPLHDIYIAKEKNHIAGFIAGDMRPSFFPHSTLGLNAYISAVYIEKSYRNTSLFNQLLDTITDNLFKKYKAEYIELHCLTNNVSAKKIWQKLGYKPFREQLRKKISY